MYCTTWGIEQIFCNSCKWKVTFKIVLKNLKKRGFTRLPPFLGWKPCLHFYPRQVSHCIWEDLLFWAASRPCSGGGIELAPVGIQIKLVQGGGRTHAQEQIWNGHGVLFGSFFT